MVCAGFFPVIILIMLIELPAKAAGNWNLGALLRQDAGKELQEVKGKGEPGLYVICRHSVKYTPHSFVSFRLR